MKARRNLELQLALDQDPTPSKTASYSPSTEDSGSPRNSAVCYDYKPSIRKDKEKSQLCKKYI